MFEDWTDAQLDELRPILDRGDGHRRPFTVEDAARIFCLMAAADFAHEVERRKQRQQQTAEGARRLHEGPPDYKRPPDEFMPVR